MSGRTGLRYEGCKAALDLYVGRLSAGPGGPLLTADNLGEVFTQVQVIEQAMLTADNERREREQAQRTMGDKSRGAP